MDSFFRQFTPEWFHWLHWAFLIGTVQVLADKTQSGLLRCITGVSYLAMMYYFIAHIEQIKFSGLPFLKKDRTRYLASTILAGILVLVAYFAISVVARAVSHTGIAHQANQRLEPMSGSCRVFC